MRAYAHGITAVSALVSCNMVFDAPSVNLTTVAVTLIASWLPDLDNSRSTIPTIMRHICRAIFKYELDTQRWLIHRSSTHSAGFTAILLLGVYLAAPAFLGPFAIGYCSHLLADTSSGPGVRLIGHWWCKSYFKIPSGSAEESIAVMIALCPIAFFTMIIVPAGGSRSFVLDLVATPDAAHEKIQTAPDHAWTVSVERPVFRVGTKPAHTQDWPGSEPSFLGNSLPTILDNEPAIPTGEYAFVSSLTNNRFLVRDKNGVAHVMGRDGSLLAIGHVKAVKGEKLHTQVFELAPTRTPLLSLCEQLEAFELSNTHFINGELALDTDFILPAPTNGYQTVTAERRRLTLSYTEAGELRRTLDHHQDLAVALVETGKLQVTVKVHANDTALLARIAERLAGHDANNAPRMAVPVEYRLRLSDLSGLKLGEGQRVMQGQVLAHTTLHEEELRLVQETLSKLAEAEHALKSAKTQAQKSADEALAALEFDKDALVSKRDELLQLADEGEGDDDDDGELDASRPLRLRAKALLNEGGYPEKIRVVQARMTDVERTMANELASLDERLVRIADQRLEMTVRIEELKRKSAVHAPADGVVMGLRVSVDGDVVVRFFLVRD